MWIRAFYWNITWWIADVILVLKDRDILESGNHDELIAKNGFYAELYNSQFEQIV